jgi:heavy metal sensor kinase
MAFSIRTRLTFWYVTLLTVSLIVFGMIFSYTLSEIFMNRIDRQVGSVANMMVHAVVRPKGQVLVPGNFDIILERYFGVRTSGTYIQILDVHGKVVARSSNLKDAVLPLSKETYESAVRGAMIYEVVHSVGRHPVRIVTKPLLLKGTGLVAIVQVGSSLEFMEEILDSVVYIFAIGVIASIVIASAIGWFLARQALKPVSEITETALRIGAESLDERIDVETPEDEIGMLATTINEMMERLEKSFLQIKQFTADASHELKTPLTIMKGEIEIAMRSGSDVAHMKETLASNLEEIDRMSYIVRNLLDLTKIEAERDTALTERVEIATVLADRFENLKRFALDSGVDMRILKSVPAAVLGDPVRIGQLFFNLMDNALKYTPSGGVVEISLESDGLVAVVKVRDTGIGISALELPFIFDRFYIVDKARTRSVGGAGLGLSICKEIVASLGGTIDVESTKDKGTTFTVKVPLADEKKTGGRV